MLWQGIHPQQCTSLNNQENSGWPIFCKCKNIHMALPKPIPNLCHLQQGQWGTTPFPAYIQPLSYFSFQITCLPCWAKCFIIRRTTPKCLCDAFTTLVSPPSYRFPCLCRAAFVTNTHDVTQPLEIPSVNRFRFPRVVGIGALTHKGTTYMLKYRKAYSKLPLHIAHQKRESSCTKPWAPAVLIL